MEWDEYAADWDGTVAVQEYALAALGSLEELAAATDFVLAGARVCDFGCGTGLLLERLAERCAHIDAVDSSPAMLDVLRAKIERHGWTHVRLSEEVPQTGEPYDLVVCSSVCAFLDDYMGAVRRLVSRLRAGGLFVQWDWELDPDEAEPFGLSRDSIRAALAAAGLVDIEVATAFTIEVEGETMRPLVGSGRMPVG